MRGKDGFSTLTSIVGILALFAMAGAAVAGLPDDKDELARSFQNPPPSAKPHTWWHWMNGNITKEGITADLTAMKRVGVGGAQIFNVDCGIPPGPVRFMSDPWRKMIQHAVKEADRLGLELCIHNCAGWSSSGGPWVKPEHAMQMVVTSEQRVKGPAHFSAVLPQPTTRLNFYRDIAVLAFRTPQGEAVTMASLAPKVTSSDPAFDGAKIVDGYRNTFAFLPAPKRDKPQYVQLEFAQPFKAWSITIAPGPGTFDCGGEVQGSEDGESFRALQPFTISREGGRPAVVLSLSEPSPFRYYRVLFKWAGARVRRVTLAEVDLSPALRVDNLEAKAAYVRADGLQPSGSRAVSPDAVLQREGIVDLTAHMETGGRLTWDAPEGDWTVLRLGYTPTGSRNAPAPPEGTGPECDKLSGEAAEEAWGGMMGKIISDLGPLAGKTLNNVLIDSYEMGSQNWTPLFREEFKRRRGYDPIVYLPTMTGRVVDNPEVTERFLWDFRRTIADLFADNYSGHFAAMGHRSGMQLSVEPYGNGPFEDFSYGSHADIPMGEFWAGGGAGGSTKLAASIAHIYGRRMIGAESFTAAPEQGRWQNDPYSLKALGDAVYCDGVNRFIFHRYAQQPWLNRFPGMTMGPWGFHFERTNTWWNQGAAWLRYLARCQYLLQQGLFVGDACYFCGEGAPISLRAGDPALPKGYDYDGCNAGVILNRMTVKDGRIVLPDGMSYRVLILPPDDTMTPALLRKIRRLVAEGATIVGPKPVRSPSLQDYPKCDQEVRSLADEIWGNCDGKTVTERPFGKGRVCWGKPMAEVLTTLNAKPDFEFASEDKAASLVYIHRRAGEADFYFVSNQRDRPEAAQCTFRVSGKAPELWHPDTGKREKVAVFEEKDGRVTVRLYLDPVGSVFVVFRDVVKAGDHVVSVRGSGGPIVSSKAKAPPKLDIQKATYGVLTVEEPGVALVTRELAGLVHEGTLTVQASNALAGDPAPNIVKQLRVEYTYNGKAFSKTVQEGQTLKIPDETVGDIEKAGLLEIRKAVYGDLPTEQTEPPEPQTVDVTAQLQALVREGILSVVASNSLAGDPASMIFKQLRVDYALDGVAHTKTVNENERLEIGGAEVSAYLSAELVMTDSGGLELRAWAPGTYEMKTASGKLLRLDVPLVPEPLEIAGSWELRFPPKWGAPAAMMLQNLISWPEHSNPGVKYFSGTATYVKDIDIPVELVKKDEALYLDLGKVKNLAEVAMNGKEFGVLWKPPFRVEVTAVAHAGRNKLEVRVTNLWPNRLIGDDQLPEDCQWNGQQLSQWPKWFLEGKPSPTGRLTFTTWKHWTKDSRLLESGLLGPVTLRAARRVAVQVP